MSETGPISPARLIQILAGMGVTITAPLAAILAQLDVALSTRASEATIAALLVQLQAVLAKMDNPADPMVVEDTGLNTNPERYKVLHSFRSQVIARAGGVATGLWTVGMGGAPVRTAGMNSYVYWMHIYNPTVGAVTAWLEVFGALITVPFALAAGQAATIDLPTVLPVGDIGIDCNASVNGVQFQIGGYEI